ncbi:hypothetical protein FKP32DRAFT_329601 [Trametes sanguinea]|nr:hypothetical protein FKP32DRAFT_329601 [Trametes sanguinea]
MRFYYLLLEPLEIRIRSPSRGLSRLTPSEPSFETFSHPRRKPHSYASPSKPRLRNNSIVARSHWQARESRTQGPRPRPKAVQRTDVGWGRARHCCAARRRRGVHQVRHQMPALATRPPDLCRHELAGQAMGCALMLHRAWMDGSPGAGGGCDLDMIEPRAGRESGPSLGIWEGQLRRVFWPVAQVLI